MESGIRCMWRKVGAGAVTTALLLGAMIPLSGTSPQGYAAAGPLPTVTVTLTPVLLLADDFATYSGRWREASSAKATVAYRDETLWMRVVSPGVAVWSVPDFEVPLSSYRLQATVRFNAGQPDGQAGIVFGYADDEHFQAVLLSAGGRLEALSYQRGRWQTLASQELLAAPVPGESVLVQMDWVNGAEEIYLVVRAGEESLIETALPAEGESGLFGLIARAGRGYVDVSFDDVMVVALRGVEEGTLGR